jgi:hypothetical protein
MRRLAILVLCAFVAASAGTSARTLLPPDARDPAPGGDCRKIAAEIGSDATWYGEFSGRRYDDFGEMFYPISARGCFVSEYECRRWQNEAMSFAGRGGVVYTRCRQGAPDY